MASRAASIRSAGSVHQLSKKAFDRLLHEDYYSAEIDNILRMLNDNNTTMDAVDFAIRDVRDRVIAASKRAKRFFVAAKVFGAFQLVAGLLSMALGVGAICTFASGYYIGYGIWAGFVFTLSGIFAIVAAHRKCRNACMMSAALVMCLLSICCGAAQFSIGVVAAVNDRQRSITGELSRDPDYLQYDIYYRRNNPFMYLYTYYCTDSYGAFTWEYSWGPVDVLLLLVGFIEIVFAIISASLACTPLCCWIRRIQVANTNVYDGRDSSVLGLENDGYDGEDRKSYTSQPTLYARSAVSQPRFYKLQTTN